MKNSKIRILGVLLLVALLFVLAGVQIFAADDSTESATGVATESELREALAAGGNVKLTGSITVNSAIEIPAGKTVTLDLNGNTVTMAVDATSTSSLIVNNGDLTIDDTTAGGKGKLTYSSSLATTGYSTSTIINYGTLTVEGGTIENTTLIKPAAVYAIDHYNGTLTVNGGSVVCGGVKDGVSYGIAIRQAIFNTDENVVVMNGGTVTGGAAGIQLHHVSTTAKNVKMDLNGGSVSGDYAVYSYYYSADGHSKTSIDISGGNYDGYVFLYNGVAGSSDYAFNVSISDGSFTEVYVYTSDSADAEVSVPAITGGSFESDVSAYCADGYEIDDNGDGTYGIKADNEAWILRNGAPKFYDTVEAAIADAQAGETVILSANVKINSRVAISENITIADYGTLTLAIVGNAGFDVADGTTVTFDQLNLDATAATGTVINGGATAAANFNFDKVSLIGNVKFGGKVNVVLGDEFAMTEGAFMTVNAGAEMVLDLNGKTVNGTDTTTKNFGLIQNNGNLTVNDTVGGGKITLTATTNSGWNRYSAVISNNPGGTLVVNGGTIEHLGGTDMAYGIDSLTNGNIGNVSVTVNGGHVKSTYRGIRQFLNSTTAENVLTINGGTVEGTNKSVFFHDPSTKANNGTIEIAEGASLVGDVYLFVTAGSTEWPVDISIAASAVEGEVITGNVPNGYDVANVGGTYGIKTGAAKINGVYYDSFADAYTAAAAGDTIVLLSDINSSAIIAIDKAIILDGNGKTLTSTAGRAINVTGVNGVTIKNLTINASGERAINVIQNATNVTVDNVTATAANYTVNVAGSAPNAVVTITNSELNGLCTVNAAAEGVQITIDNSVINCNDNNTTVGESYAALSLGAESVNGKIIATNTVINVTEGSAHTHKFQKIPNIISHQGTANEKHNEHTTL